MTDQKDLRFSYRFDGGALVTQHGRDAAPFTSLASGAHTFEVRSRDMDFNVDPDPPKIGFRSGAGLSGNNLGSRDCAACLL